MGGGPVFNSQYFSDSEILLKLDKIAEDRNRLFDKLASAGGSDLATLPELAKQFHDLDQICTSFEKLKKLIIDLNEIEELISQGDTGDGESLRALLEEYTKVCADTAERLYRALLEKGHISEDIVDGTDMDILKFIEYAGPEYAWRLGINVGIDTLEARQRLEKLLEKGLLEKVQGTMLEGYHREKDWVKHMNHTYYRLSRKGKLFLRQLRG